jgi:tetratricopeptide (TPR) repeat protein
VVPRGIRDVIGRRLRKLSPDCRRLLEAGAIFGREFRLETLSRQLAIERAAMLDAVDEAASARIVTKLPGAPTSLRFVHELIRETVYDGLGGAERAMLHRCAGEALAELYSEDEPHLAELARHFLAGDEPVRALEYARRAADQALKLLAYEEAARLYRSALEALAAGESPSSGARCELLLALGEAQARAGAMPQARESFLAAAELARSSAAGELLARAALGYGGRFVWLRAGTDRRIVPLLEDALALLPGEDSILRARVMARLAGALRDLPSAEKRVALCREAVAIARRLGDPATLAYTLDGLSALAAPDVRAWFELAGEMVEITHAADDRERMFNGRVSRAGAAMSLGDMATANADVETMALLAAELRQPAQLWMTTVFRAMRALFEGRLDEAERLIPEARSIGQTAEAWDSETVYQIQLFSLRREQARLDEVDELVQRTAGDLPARPLFRCMAVAAHVALGRSDKGRETIDALAERDFAAIPLETEWGTSMSLLAEACASLGDTLRSGTLYELLLPHADTNIFNHPEVSRGATARYLGLLAASSGRWADAAGHFEHALELNARMGARPWLAWTQHDYARALIAAGEAGERSTQLSAAAAATAQELGLACLASQVAAQE